MRTRKIRKAPRKGTVSRAAIKKAVIKAKQLRNGEPMLKEKYDKFKHKPHLDCIHPVTRINKSYITKHVVYTCNACGYKELYLRDSYFRDIMVNK